MSGTAGIQNYLSNVFRPIYTYDTTTGLFTPKLSVSNIDNYSGNTISVFTAAIGDSNSNVYVGSNAGNPYNITKNVSNVTAVGFGAGSNLSNDCNSVYIGWYAGSGAVNTNNVISIGANSGGGGSSNIFIGSSTGSVGDSNILIGHGINGGSLSNQVRIGAGGTTILAGDINKNWVGIGGYLSPTDVYTHLDVSGNSQFAGRMGLNKTPVYTLDVNGSFNVNDGAGALLLTGGLATATKGFSSYHSNMSYVPAGFWTLIPLNLPTGLAMITAQKTSSRGSNYHSMLVFINFDATGFYYNPIILSERTDASGSGGLRIGFNNAGPLVVVSNTSGSYYSADWSVTLFPMM